MNTNIKNKEIEFNVCYILNMHKNENVIPNSSLEHFYRDEYGFDNGLIKSDNHRIDSIKLDKIPDPSNENRYFTFKTFILESDNTFYEFVIIGFKGVDDKVLEYFIRNVDEEYK